MTLKLPAWTCAALPTHTASVRRARACTCRDSELRFVEMFDELCSEMSSYTLSNPVRGATQRACSGDRMNKKTARTWRSAIARRETNILSSTSFTARAYTSVNTTASVVCDCGVGA